MAMPTWVSLAWGMTGFPSSWLCWHLQHLPSHSGRGVAYLCAAGPRLARALHGMAEAEGGTGQGICRVMGLH